MKMLSFRSWSAGVGVPLKITPQQMAALEAEGKPVVESCPAGAVVGPGKLTQQELDELQAISDKHNTPIDVIGSRAEGRGRNIDKPELPVEKGDDKRSDIDVRIDGQADIDSRGRLSDELRGVGNGAGSIASSTGLPSDPPFIKIRPGQPAVLVK